MFLESLKIKNFRKFRDKNNTIHFVSSKAISTNKDESESSLISPSSTLIIGKNNTGKTTVARALTLISDKKKPSAHDFNMDYLRCLIAKYEAKLEKNENLDGMETPCLEFELKIRVIINDPDDVGSDLVNNLYQFVMISSETPDLVSIVVKCQMKEDGAFRNKLASIIKGSHPENAKDKNLDSLNKLESLCEYMGDDKLFKLTYYTAAGIEVSDPLLGELIKIKEIKANRHLGDHVLTENFQKIILSQFNSNEEDKKKLGEGISNINDFIEESVSDKGISISGVLKEVESSNHVGVRLSGNVTEELILKQLIKYSFSEGEDYIPENQFGLGYVNLLNIIGEIIHYVDGYESESFRNKINLLFIEEPEAFMHPQMQEFFIARIDSAVRKVLELSKGEELHCQIAITTHSSHIVNSKIHSCNSFNDINYLTSVNKISEVVQLNDKVVSGKDNYKDDESLKFIKKHIKYKVSELFFADAVIFVEGVTEETILRFYLDEDENLKNYYISVFNINGAYAKLYYPLIRVLKIPCLIVTDLDIRREGHEKNKKNESEGEENTDGSIGYKQITSLKGRETTNETIKTFENIKAEEEGLDTVKNDIENIEYFDDENLYVVFQKDAVEGQFATSFEEALILTNFKDDILNNVLEQCKPRIYKDIVGEDRDYTRLVVKSYEFQKKLADSKSDFANNLLYQLIVSADRDFSLPKYIRDGLEWLAKELDGLVKLGGDAKDVSK